MSGRVVEKVGREFDIRYGTSDWHFGRSLLGCRTRENGRALFASVIAFIVAS